MAWRNGEESGVVWRDHNMQMSLVKGRDRSPLDGVMANALLCIDKYHIQSYTVNMASLTKTELA